MSVSMRIFVDARRVDGLMEHLRDVPAALENFLEDAEDLIWRELSDRVPIRTGNLLTSMRVTRTERGVNVSFQAPYAPFVEAGTRPHIIQARNVSALRFDVAGKTIFAKSVSHPGFIGRWFVRDTKEAIKEPIFRLAVDNVVKHIFGEGV